MPPDPAVLTGRCYCGASRVLASAPPRTVTYCHCTDCRRLTGAPVACFAAFDQSALSIETTPDRPREINPGVKRWSCQSCGSQLAATYDYLPGQIYVPVGLLDQIDSLAPEQHSHADNAVHWLHVSDDLPRFSGSGRTRLNTASQPR